MHDYADQQALDAVIHALAHPKEGDSKLTPEAYAVLMAAKLK